jgi:hypothetical protein
MQNCNIRKSKVLASWLASLVLLSVPVSAADGNGRKLDPRIKTVKPNQSRGKSFNPSITIYDNEMIIAYGKPRKNRKIKVDELEKFLLDLPVSAWPEGRMVSLMECGVASSSPGVREYRKRTWAAVNAVFKRLDIEPNYLPSA